MFAFLHCAPLPPRSTNPLHQRLVRCCLSERGALKQKIRTETGDLLSARNIVIVDTCWRSSTLCVSITSSEDASGEVDSEGATVDDCTYASQVIGEMLDASDDFDSGKYTLEVSTPGTAKDGVLVKDREFEAFKSFPVVVRTLEKFKGSTEMSGTLIGRDEESVTITLKGRRVAIPRSVVSQVKLS